MIDSSDLDPACWFQEATLLCSPCEMPTSGFCAASVGLVGAMPPPSSRNRSPLGGTGFTNLSAFIPCARSVLSKTARQPERSAVKSRHPVQNVHRTESATTRPARVALTSVSEVLMAEDMVLPGTYGDITSLPPQQGFCCWRGCFLSVLKLSESVGQLGGGDAALPQG